jgi:hypothetical protein
VANLRLLSLVTKAIFYLKKGIQLIDFGAERFGISIGIGPAIRFNLACRTPAHKDFHYYQG